MNESLDRVCWGPNKKEIGGYYMLDEITTLTNGGVAASKKDKCCFVITVGTKFTTGFETDTEAQRDQVVHALKIFATNLS
jgi:hypothetical protein